MSLHGRHVLITGGMGFAGSNLAIRLVGEGAHVAVVDSLVDGCGGNPFNIDPVKHAVVARIASIDEPSAYRDLLADTDLIFNFAGEISHIHSMRFPERDLEINTTAQLRFLEECKRLRPGIRIVYAGTRQIYGAPKYLPVDEDHPVSPVDFNGIHKYAAIMYHLMLTRMGQLDAVVLQLTNIYGPRMALTETCQGFLSTFLRRLVRGSHVEIFGDGSQVRDPIYIDDAVDAFLMAAGKISPGSRVYNISGPVPLSISEIASMASQAAGVTLPVYQEFPADRKAIDVGSFYSDSGRFEREYAWKPSILFQTGIARTLAYFRQNREHYLPPSDFAECVLNGGRVRANSQ